MDFRGKRIGWAVTGSHCTISRVLPEMRRLVDMGAEVRPIASPAVLSEPTRFGAPEQWRAELEAICGHRLWTSVVEAEPIGPQKLLDLLIVAPCTGNTLAKIANAITDGPVTMAVKAQLRNRRPVLLAVSSNDLLGLNAVNLARLLVVRDIYFVPFGQDDPTGKPRSLQSDLELIILAAERALQGEQLQPLLIGRQA